MIKIEEIRELEIPVMPYQAYKNTYKRKTQKQKRHFQPPKTHFTFNIGKRLNYYNLKRFFDIGAATMIFLWWLFSTIEILATGTAAHTWNFYQFLVNLCEIFAGLF